MYENNNNNNNMYNYTNGENTPADADPAYSYTFHQSNGLDPEPVKTKAKGKRSGAGKIVALALCCSLIGGAAGAAGTAYFVSRDGVGDGNEAAGTVITEGEHLNTPVSLARTNTGKELTAAEIYAQNVNSTVGITTEITTNYFGFQTTTPAAGSGFILTEDGYIVTNYHVIEDSRTVRVTTYDGTTYDAKIVGGDPSNDIAVLKIDAQNLTPVVLGSSDELRVGDPVVAIGNPLGELTFSLTHGYVSALDRSVTLSSGITMDLIQTDAAINAGNSGGALFNVYGEVVGITNAKYSSNSSGEASIDNIGFAIPMDSVKNLIAQIIEKGYVSSPYIGVTIRDVTDEVAALGVPRGAIINSLEEDGPAARAGLRVNDIVTAVNGSAIQDSDGLKDAVSASTPGDRLELDVYRGGETVKLTITVGEQTTQDTQSTQTTQNDSRQQQDPIQDFGYNFPWGFMSRG